MISAIAALIVSNSELSVYYFETLNKYLFIGINNFGLKLSVLHWINDALMAIFFFFVVIISTVALILILDTFKDIFIKIFPNIKILLNNLYETLKDVTLFFYDLLN